MSRSGYTECCENLELYRGAVNAAIKGNRGQKLIADLLTALDAMPEKRLISKELINSEREVCALGAVGLSRGVKIDDLDGYDADTVAGRFDIAPCLAREIAYENDEGAFYQETPEKRWQRMRKWCVDNLRPERAPHD